MHLDISTNEDTFLKPIMQRFSARAKYTVTLNDLVTDWEDFVSMVEEGYPLTVYDYYNDMDARDMLREVIITVPYSLGSKIADFLKPIDERFYQATKGVERALITTGDIKDYPWWYRVPLRMGDELKKDLQADGFV